MHIYFGYKFDILRDYGLKFGRPIHSNPTNYIMMKYSKTSNSTIFKENKNVFTVFKAPPSLGWMVIKI